jgi:hypothetical protein
MPTEGRKKILHYRNGSGNAQPVAGNMEKGEIAMTYTHDYETLYIKNSANTVVPFSSDHIREDWTNDQDEKVSSAIGLTINTEVDTGEVNYSYHPTSELLQECTTMYDSVECLAGELQNCLELIEQMKQNVYMIDLGFKVEPNAAVTANTVSYSTTFNGNPTNPKTAVVSKRVNDGTSTVIINNTTQSSGSTVSVIEGAKEVFTIEVEPNLTGAMNMKSEITKYLCYVGHSSATTLTETIVNGFTKKLSDGEKFDAEVTTAYGDYIWILVPSSIQVAYVTSGGITVTLDQTTKTFTNSMGTFTAYRSYKQLDVATWPLVIYNRE